MHCVTTSWLELGKTAPIGQEFELIVLNDLEFQLTLQTKLEEPKAKPVPESPTKSVKTPKSSTFSRVFASPKKRKELEMKQQEEAQRAERQRQQQAQASRRSMQPTAWDLLHNLVAKDGSFARSYVCLKDHESSAYGRPFTVDVPCFNEWASEDVQTVSSVKSKRSTTSMGMQRRAPYKIGKLELQLLFVPKPKGASEQDMPKSMNACIRELKEAEATVAKTWEGHLSQQGGDCPVRLNQLSSLNRRQVRLTPYSRSTGAAASSPYHPANSPPTMKPPANPAQPSTSPKPQSSSTTNPPSLKRKQRPNPAVAANPPSPRKKKAICSSKKASGSDLRTARRLISMPIVQRIKMAG